MEWTDISITVAKRDADTAEAIATMVANGGIYIEDYSDLEQQAWEIAHVDLIEQDLLDKPRDIVIVHMYIAPVENPAEVLHPGQYKRVAIVTGSEGGFSVEEAEAAKAAGAVTVGLGPRILRCETAPLAALTSVMLLTGNLE